MKTRFSTTPRGFTLVELLAAMVVLAMLMVIIFGIFNQASKAWLLAENRTETFQSARLALDMITRDLESAIVGVHTNSASIIPYTRLPFLAFKGSDHATIIDNSGNQSSPAFSPPTFGGGTPQSTPPNDAIFFVTQAPDSRSNGTFIDLAECGYYVVFANSSGMAGMTKGNYYLFRHYVRSNTGGWDVFTNPTGWWTTPMPSTNDTPLVENALRFTVEYEYATGTAPNGTTWVYNWNIYGSGGPPNPPITDPTTQLPRAIHIQLSVLDRRFATRLAAINNNSAISNLGSVTTANTGVPVVDQTLREGLRTFFRSVYLRGAYQ